MHFYFNLNPPKFEGETDTIVLEAPSSVMDVLLENARSISEGDETKVNKLMREILKESVNIILEKENERKNRKTKKW